MRIRTLISALGCAAVLLAGAVASADGIGINFIGGGPPSGAEDLSVDNADGPAGVVPQSDWNNLPNASGAVGSVIDSNGIVLGATGVSWTSNNTWSVGNGSTTADHILMNGYLDTNSTDPTTVTISNVPYALYDVYVYTDGDNTNDRIGSFDINGTAHLAQDVATFAGVYDDATADGIGNYLLFEGLSGDTLAMATPVNFRAPLNGLQIVDRTPPVPEPTAALLYGAGMALVGTVVRRRQSR